jgi:hypothetical protein
MFVGLLAWQDATFLIDFWLRRGLRPDLRDHFMLFDRPSVGDQAAQDVARQSALTVELAEPSPPPPPAGLRERIAHRSA